MTTVLFLPSADTGYRWLRVAGERVTARGEGLPDPDPDGETVAIVPADAVTLHWAELPSRSDAQAVAAARMLAADASAAPVGELHVAVGREDGAERPIGVVAAARMRDWLAALAADGVDPDRVLPAPMLLPRPLQGYVRAEVAGQSVVRGATSGFADEGWLTDLIAADAPTTTLDATESDLALAAAVAAPALDLRQGAFARRRRVELDWALIRRLALLALAILAVTLAIDLVRIARYSLAADALEARAEALARAGLPRGEAVNDADRQLDARLAGLRGPGQGFTRSAAAVFAAVRTVPGAELTSLAFADSGELRVGVATGTEGQIVDLRDRITAAGFPASAGTFTSANGRMTGTLTVRAR